MTTMVMNTTTMTTTATMTITTFMATNTTVGNIADSRVVLGTIVHTYDCGYLAPRLACNGSSTNSMHCLHSS